MGWTSRASRGRRRLQAATVVLVAVSATVAAEAQTLRNPNRKPRPPTTSSQQSKPVKPCPAYGPGFVQVAGTDLCIKVGGSVEVDVGR
jgi:hypothetical protein